MGARILLLGVALGAVSASQSAYAAQPANVLGIAPSSIPLLPNADMPDLRTLSETYRLPPNQLTPPSSTLRDPGYRPSSMELTLGALATLAVARGLRALKHAACVRCLPGWYCDLAPANDHAPPNELSVTFLAVYPSARPFSREWRPRTIRTARATSRLALLVAKPRGPPIGLPHASVSRT